MQDDLFAPPKTRPPVQYLPRWLPEHRELMALWATHLPWEQRHIRMYGSETPMPRLECWLGPAGATYTYSGVTYEAQPLDARPELVALLRRVSVATGCRFNAVFANLYRTGADSIGWHRDDEPALGDPAASVIASVSLGARRQFVLRQVADPSNRHAWDLGEGDLLVMGAGSQARWEHSVSKTARPVGARLVLTFRRLVGIAPLRDALRPSAEVSRG